MMAEQFDENILYWIWLTLLPEIGEKMQNALLDTFGTPCDLYHVREDMLESLGFLSEDKRQKLQTYRSLDTAREIQKACEETGTFIITRDDPFYPSKISRKEDLPILLYGKGEKPDSSITGTGVVGARRCTQEDKEKCIEIVQKQPAGTVIISGMAKGIDSYAHTAAIRSGLPTIAFLGCGPDICYPSEHKELKRQIENTGLVLSEYPPGTKPRPYFFPKRNRLIAAWSEKLCIIGAGERSGTRYTAEYFGRYHEGKSAVVV